ncbi:MAG: methyltransferase domain-containing protein [Dehalococcoidia bacterium]|nr:methyltransferase domain-containing protein [Dehalococcoidia bacterium]MSQ16146.1 methyltransferase domain-containing protein [Dehalococcoidia bacterium]
MSSRNPDPDVLKEQVRQEWDVVAQARLAHEALFLRFFQPITDKLITIANVQPGQRILDVATGSGEPALTVARLAGTQGHIIGVDQSPGMLDAARQRAQRMNLI